jgi:hypothetical protein
MRADQLQAKSFRVDVPLDQQRRFLRGGCFVFAITLLRSLKRKGIPAKLMGLFVDDVCHHAFLAHDGKAYDCRGELPLDAVAIGEGSLVGGRGDIRPLTVKQIQEIAELDFTNIEREMPRYLRFGY